MEEEREVVLNIKESSKLNQRQRQRQVNLCEFEASLLYRASSRAARATQRNPVLEKQTNKKQTKQQKRIHSGQWWRTPLIPAL